MLLSYILHWFVIKFCKICCTLYVCSTSLYCSMRLFMIFYIYTVKVIQAGRASQPIAQKVVGAGVACQPRLIGVTWYCNYCLQAEPDHSYPVARDRLQAQGQAGWIIELHVPAGFDGSVDGWRGENTVWRALWSFRKEKWGQTAPSIECWCKQTAWAECLWVSG